jgi:hypothetical protein
MKHQIAIFRFTLSPRQSVGPALLQALWAHACQSPQVSVGRQPGARDGQPTYSLYASQHLQDLPLVERRLREALEAHNLRASLIPVM